MPKLIVNPTSAARREIRLSRNLLSIGRDPSNDLVLPDAMVSRRHAVIECRGNQYYLRDCNSSNGSVVNGDRISERSLRDGDLVAIGTARLLFREEIEIEDAGAKVVQHPSAPRFLCPGCRSEYRKGDLFCRECGAGLKAPEGPPKAVCASCGTAVVLPARFCNACGARLPMDEASLVETPGMPVPPEPPAVERDPSPAAPLEPPVQTTDPLPGLSATASPDGIPAVLPAVASPLLSPLEPGKPAEEPAAPARGSRFPTQPSDAARPPARPVAFPERPRAPGSDRPWRAKPARAEAAPAASSPGPGPLPAPAGFGPRALAGLVDAILAGLAQAVIVGPLVYVWGLRGGQDGASVLPMVVPVLLAGLAAAVAIGYHVAFWAWRGATPGKSWLGLQVVGDDAKPIGLGKALARGVGYALSSATLGLGFLMIAKGGFGLHDRIGGTRVIARRAGE
jgi:uncharacterized RDD family membrane protein YckC